MEYEVFTAPTAGGEIQKYAKFPDGGIATVLEDKHGEYFCIRNKYIEPDTYGMQEFSHRIGDAIRAIQDGDGDVIEIIHAFGEYIYVHHYLDREIGEELRAKSLVGWKDIKIKWSVILMNNLGAYYVVADKNSLALGSGNAAPKLFNTSSDARAFADELLSCAKVTVKEFYDKTDFISDSRKREDIYFETMNSIGKLNSPIGLMVYDILGSYLKRPENFEYKLRKLDIVLRQEVVSIGSAEETNLFS